MYWFSFVIQPNKIVPKTRLPISAIDTVGFLLVDAVALDAVLVELFSSSTGKEMTDDLRDGLMMSSKTTKTSSSNSQVKSTSSGLLVLLTVVPVDEGGFQLSKSTTWTFLSGGVAIIIVLSMRVGSGELDERAEVEPSCVPLLSRVDLLQ